MASMSEYLIPLTSACTLITLNYMATKIRNKMLIDTYEHIAAPLFTGLACIIMILQPLPPQLGLVDLRLIPVFMAGLRYGIPIALISIVIPTLFDFLSGHDQWILHSVMNLMVPAIVSAFFHRKHYRYGYNAIQIRTGLFICFIVFVVQQLYRYMTLAASYWSDPVSPLFILLLTCATITLLIVMVNDENKTWILQRQLEVQANQDSLTGLPNMRSFMHIADSAINKRKIAIFMIDIDNFKKFNDQFGHLEGDRLLQAIGSLLRHQIYERDYVARYGGEEFILMSTETDPVKLAQYAKHLCATVARHSLIEDLAAGSPSITISIGISIAGQPLDDLKRLIREADQALYESKYSGKNRYTFYDPNKSTEAGSA